MKRNKMDNDTHWPRFNPIQVGFNIYWIHLVQMVNYWGQICPKIGLL